MTFEAKAEDFKMCPRGRPRGQGRPRGLNLCVLCHNHKRSTGNDSALTLVFPATHP